MDKLPVAKKMSKKAICLLIYPDLNQMDVKRVIKIQKTL